MRPFISILRWDDNGLELPETAALDESTRRRVLEDAVRLSRRSGRGLLLRIQTWGVCAAAIGLAFWVMNRFLSMSWLSAVFHKFLCISPWLSPHLLVRGERWAPAGAREDGAIRSV